MGAGEARRIDADQVRHQIRAGGNGYPFEQIAGEPAAGDGKYDEHRHAPFAGGN